MITIVPEASTHERQEQLLWASYVDGFVAHLEACGYARSTIALRHRAVVRWLHWGAASGIAIAQLDEAIIARFASQIRTSRRRGRRGSRSVRGHRAAATLFVSYLRRVGAAAPLQPGALRDAPLVAEFRTWMTGPRAVSGGTADGYLFSLRPFFVAVGTDPTGHDVGRVRDFVVGLLCARSRAFAKRLVCALRAWFAFLAAHGRCAAGMTAAVPRVPTWRLASLPSYLEPDVVDRVIQSCDTSIARGLRDRAILLLLARLGLRAGDIVAMRLADIDWVSAHLRVRGKSRRETLLPLPQDVGDALLEYVQRGRPRVALDRVFLCATAPIRPLATSATVSTLVERALHRAGVQDTPSRGAHLLRHSAATAMLRAGGTLETVAVMLRHQSTDTTMLYAKVDLPTLQRVTQPWPKDAPCAR